VDAANAGHEGSIVVQKVRDMKDSEGFNALTTPTKISSSRRHRPREGRPLGAPESSSIASLLLTTEALICDLPEKKEPSQGGGGAVWAAAWRHVLTHVGACMAGCAASHNVLYCLLCRHSSGPHWSIRVRVRARLPDASRSTHRCGQPVDFQVLVRGVFVRARGL